MANRYYIGIDLGGTKTLTAIVDDEANIVSTVKVRTQAEEGVKIAFGNLKRSIEQVIAESPVPAKSIGGIGIGFPGSVDDTTGVVSKGVNMPGWEGLPIREDLQATFHIKTAFDNDVNVGTLGEFMHGSGRGYANGICVFVGTGIGGGIVMDGKLVRGASGTAGEIGHIIIDRKSSKKCGCGNYGCWEALASRTALVERLIKEAKKKPSVLEKKSKGFKEQIRSRILREAFLEKDAVTIDGLKRECKLLGIGIANCINILNPEVVILGGGLMEALGIELINDIVMETRKYAFAPSFASVKITLSRLMDQAGIIGGAALARERFG